VVVPSILLLTVVYLVVVSTILASMLNQLPLSKEIVLCRFLRCRQARTEKRKDEL
jgi:hypothetical protein